jgi:predicted aminopeptidase
VLATRGVALAALVALSGCWSLSYVAKQGIGELKLLHSRRRIVDVLADPTVDEEVRKRLALALEARRFGVEQLGLHDGDAFTRYIDLHGRPVAVSVWAAYPDRLEPVTHAFPIAGRVPYLGFFRDADARSEEARLRRMGYDTYVGAISGFSTRGIIADPIFSSMLEGSPAHIVEVTLHEMLHSTVYLPGQTAWNESLATVVGFYGAYAFFRLQGGETGAARVVAEARERTARQQRFARFLEGVTAELKELYARPISADEKVRLREPIFARAQKEYLRLFPPRPGQPPPSFASQPLNNAVILAATTYFEGTPEHLKLLRALGGDLPAFVKVYKRAVERDHPLEWLRNYVRARTK